MTNQADLIHRACAAWFRSGETARPRGDAYVETYHARLYVVLRNAEGILAVYRVRSSGLLRRLRRWPAALDVAA